MTIRTLVLPDGSQTSYDDDRYTYEQAVAAARVKYPDAFARPTEPLPTEKPSAFRRLGDVGVMAAKGIVATGEGAVGLLDIPTGGYAGKGLESLGVNFRETQQILDDLYSPQQKAANAALRNADGFVDTLVAGAQNPSAVLTTIGESIAPMLAGGVYARGAQALLKVGRVAAASIGEGATMAGSAAEQIRQQDEEGLLGAKGTTAALGTGIAGSLAGRAGAKLANRFGIGDIDVGMAARMGVQDLEGEISRKGGVSFTSALVKGGVSEGVFEELPQSIQEQMWQNWATDKPIMEGVGSAAATGMMAGAGMGGPYAAVTRNAHQAEASTEAPAAEPSVAPVTPTEYVAQPTVPQQGTMEDMFSGVRATAPEAAPIQGEAQPVRPAPGQMEMLNPTQDAISALMKTSEGTQTLIDNFITTGAGRPDYQQTLDTLRAHKAELVKAEASAFSKATPDAAGNMPASEYVATPTPKLNEPKVSLAGDEITAEYLKSVGIHRGNKALAAMQDKLLSNPNFYNNREALYDTLDSYINTNKSGPAVERMRKAATQVRADIDARVKAEEAARAALEVEKMDQAVAAEQEAVKGKGLAGLGALKSTQAQIDEAYAARGAQLAAEAEARAKADEAARLADEPKMDQLQAEMAPAGSQLNLFGGVQPAARAVAEMQQAAEPTDFANKRDFPGQSTLFTRAGKPMPQKGAKNAVQKQSADAEVPSGKGKESEVNLGLQKVVGRNAEPQKAAKPGKAVKQKVAAQEEVAPEIAPEEAALVLTGLREVSAKEKNSEAGKRARTYIQEAGRPDATASDFAAAKAFLEDHRAKQTEEKPKAAPKKAKAAAQPVEESQAETIARLKQQQKELNDKLDEMDAGTPAYRATEVKLSRVKNELRAAAQKTKAAKSEEAAAVEADMLDTRSTTERKITMDRPAGTISDAKTELEGIRAAVAGDKDASKFIDDLLGNATVTEAQVVFTNETPIDKNTGARVFAQYDPNENVILMHRGATANDLIHEATHARTMAALREDPEFRQKIVDLRKEVLDIARENALPIDDVYGMADGKYELDEFVSEVYGNPEFRSFLKGIRDKKGRTIFDKLKNFIGKLFGNNTTIVDDVIEAVDLHADKLGTRGDVTTRYGVSMLNVARSTPEQVEKSVNDGLKSLLAPVTHKIGDVIDYVKQNTMTLNQLTQSFGRMFQHGQKNYLENVRDQLVEQSVKEQQYIRMGEEIEKEYLRAVDRKFAGRANQMMAESTLNGVFPDMTYEQNLERGVVASETEGSRKAWQELHDKFNALVAEMNRLNQGSGDAYAKTFRQMYEHGKFLYDEKLRIIEEKMGESFAERLKRAEEGGLARELTQLHRERKAFEERMGILRSRMKGPYFPLSRFGNHIVTYESDAMQAERDKAEAVRSELHTLEQSADIMDIDNANADLSRAKESLKRAKAGSKAAKLDAERVAALEKQLAEYETSSKDLLAKRKKLREEYDALEKSLDLMAGMPEHRVVKAFESASEARAAYAKMLADRGLDPKTQTNVNKFVAAEYGERSSTPATREFMDRLNAAVAGTMDPQDAAKISTMMSSVMTELAISDTVRRQLRRKGVAGYDENMFRSFGKMVRADAKFLSKLEHADKVRAAMSDLRQYVSAQRGDNSALSTVANTVEKHIQGQIQYVGKELSGKVTSFTSAWMLFTSPAYVAINTAQSHLVALPVLAAQSNPSSALKDLNRGLGDAMKVVKASADKGADTSFVKKWSNVLVDVDVVRQIAGDEKADLVSYMLDRQLIDISLSSDAGLTSSEGVSMKEEVMRAIAAAPHLTEVVGRVGTAFAAYETFKKTTPAPGEDATAAEIADYKQKLYASVEQVLDNTHFNYSSHNEALVWKRIPFAHTLLQFRKYQQGMLYLTMRNAAVAIGKVKDATPQERKAARAVLAYLAGTHSLAAGAVGLPMSGLAMFVMDAAMAAAGGDDDEPWDTKEQIKEGITAVFGEEIGNVVSLGLPAMIGLDISQRVGAGDIASVFRMPSESAKGADWMRQAMINAAGPFVGLTVRAGEGAMMLANGDYMKGVEKLAPSIVSNAVRAFRYETEGLTTKYGREVIPAEEFSAADIGMRALGFGVEKEREYYDEQAKYSRLKAHYKAQEDELKKMYTEARQTGEGMPELMKRLREVNASRIERGGKPIVFSQLVQSYNQTQRRARDTTESGVLIPKRDRWMMED